MNNAGTNSFLRKENVEMIWELIADEEFTQDKTERQMMDMQNLFITDIREFYEREKSIGHDLMSMNKMFIENILQKLSNVQNVQSTESTALNLREPVIELKKPQAITAEDIQASRMNEFEKQFAERQNEFSKSMTLKVPEKPSFNDEMDKPIGEMEDLIARTLAQRNFDIEHIQQNVDKEKVKSFLMSQETSIKSEKGETRKNMQEILKSSQRQRPAYNVGNNEVKYIQIGKEELSELNEVIDLQRAGNERRQVSWADEENIKFSIIDEQQEKPNIFSKLKMRSRENAASLSPFENVLEMNLKSRERDTNPKTTKNYEADLKNLVRKVDNLNSKVDAIFEFIKNANKITNTNKLDENTI